MEKLSKKNHTFWSAACKVLSLKPNYQLTSAEQNSFKKLLNNVPTCHHMCIPSEPNEEPEYQGKFLKVPSCWLKQKLDVDLTWPKGVENSTSKSLCIRYLFLQFHQN